MRRAVIPVPATAPTGSRGRKPSFSGTATPGSNSSPDRMRKPSSAAPSVDESPSRRPSAWTTRPSMVGMMAANRFGMGLVRKMRGSTSASKRGSSFCGEKPEPPPPNLEPTYRLEPKSPFKSFKVEEVIQSTLQDYLKDRSYRPNVATILCRKMSDDLRERVKKLGFERYRLVANVVMGEKKDQGVIATSRCAWDDKRDSYATATFQGQDFFCTASVYGVYKE